MRIAIKGCVAHVDRYKAQLDTWIKGNEILCWYFTGPSLDVPDGYESLPAKTKAICAACLKQEFVFMCDTDTYVSVPRLLASGYEQHDYSGYVLDTLAIPYCSGPHYWLSNRALRILAEADWSQYPIPGYTTCEDVMVGSVLRAHGILPHHDHRYAPFEPVLPTNDIISQHLSSRETYKIEFMYEAHKRANP